MSEPRPLFQIPAPMPAATRIASVALVVTPRAITGDGLVAGGWDEDPGRALHGHSLDALLENGLPVAFVRSTPATPDTTMPSAPVLPDALADSAVRPVLLGSTAMLVEATAARR